MSSSVNFPLRVGPIIPGDRTTGRNGNQLFEGCRPGGRDFLQRLPRSKHAPDQASQKRSHLIINTNVRAMTAPSRDVPLESGFRNSNRESVIILRVLMIVVGHPVTRRKTGEYRAPLQNFDGD